MNMKQNGKIKENAGPVDKLISVITYIVFALFSLICIYPFYYIFINTISANDLSEKGKIIFWPQQIHFRNYLDATKIPGLLQAAQISVARTLIGTACTVLLAGFLGYMFTRETMWKRKLWYRFVVLTMYFNAGIIPWYITIGYIMAYCIFWYSLYGCCICAYLCIYVICVASFGLSIDSCPFGTIGARCVTLFGGYFVRLLCGICLND